MYTNAVSSPAPLLQIYVKTQPNLHYFVPLWGRHTLCLGYVFTRRYDIRPPETAEAGETDIADSGTEARKLGQTGDQNTRSATNSARGPGGVNMCISDGKRLDSRAA